MNMKIPRQTSKAGTSSQVRAEMERPEDTRNRGGVQTTSWAIRKSVTMLGLPTLSRTFEVEKGETDYSMTISGGELPSTRCISPLSSLIIIA